MPRVAPEEVTATKRPERGRGRPSSEGVTRRPARMTDSRLTSSRARCCVGGEFPGGQAAGDHARVGDEGFEVPPRFGALDHRGERLGVGRVGDHGADDVGAVAGRLDGDAACAPRSARATLSRIGGRAALDIGAAGTLLGRGDGFVQVALGRHLIREAAVRGAAVDGDDVQPSAASAAIVAAPIPRAAPVTIATRRFTARRASGAKAAAAAPGRRVR